MLHKLLCIHVFVVFSPSSHRGADPAAGRAQRLWDPLPGGGFPAPAGHRADRACGQVVQGAEDPLPAEQPHPQNRYRSVYRKHLHGKQSGWGLFWIIWGFEWFIWTFLLPGWNNNYATYSRNYFKTLEFEFINPEMVKVTQNSSAKEFRKFNVSLLSELQNRFWWVILI